MSVRARGDNVHVSGATLGLLSPAPARHTIGRARKRADTPGAPRTRVEELELRLFPSTWGAAQRSARERLCDAEILFLRSSVPQRKQ